jgi:threonine/homoserine/homoserine lactone efflux protein
MDPILNVPLFLFSVVIISLSGVMMPGPVMAVTIAKGRKSGNAGALIALGHGIIEIPLMVIIYFGFAQFFTDEAVRRLIGLIGGLMLGYMGIQMFKVRDHTEIEGSDTGFNSIISGIITTSANPYFFLWWATIGSALVLNSTIFGLSGFLLFAVGHWSCDFFWDLFISKAVFRSRGFWDKRVHRIVFGVCASILLFFGVWFVYSALLS